MEGYGMSSMTPLYHNSLPQFCRFWILRFNTRNWILNDNYIGSDGMIGLLATWTDQPRQGQNFCCTSQVIFAESRVNQYYWPPSTLGSQYIHTTDADSFSHHAYHLPLSAKEVWILVCGLHCLVILLKEFPKRIISVSRITRRITSQILVFK